MAQKDGLPERLIENFLFASRWLLAPFFMALVVALAVLLFKACRSSGISSRMPSPRPRARSSSPCWR